MQTGIIKHPIEIDSGLASLINAHLQIPHLTNTVLTFRLNKSPVFFPQNCHLFGYLIPTIQALAPHIHSLVFALISSLFYSGKHDV